MNDKKGGVVGRLIIWWGDEGRNHSQHLMQQQMLAYISLLWMENMYTWIILFPLPDKEDNNGELVSKLENLNDWVREFSTILSLKREYNYGELVIFRLTNINFHLPCLNPATDCCKFYFSHSTNTK